jgi:hypothetical protein
MSYATRISVTVTTDASGDATAYTDAVNGQISSITYTKPAGTPYDNTADFTITTETTGRSVWAQSNVTATTTVAPRQATHGVDGVASLYAAGGTAVQAPIAVANERIKIVVAQGGNVKIGTFTITLV